MSHTMVRGTLAFRIPEWESVFRSFPARVPQALNTLLLAHAVFEIEKAVKGGPVRNATIPLFAPTSIKYDLGVLREIIHDLLTFVLVEDINIKFRLIRAGREAEDAHQTFLECPNACLFSGGVDSYAGVLLAKEKLKTLEAVFCAHSDQSKIIHLVRKLQRTRLARAGITVHKVKVPSMQARGYAQLRGFLYMVASAAWMHLLKANRLIVTECGPTMYQPRFAPFDIITMTTHPVVIESASRTIGFLLQREVEIVTPFEDLTKAEVMAICPDRNGLKRTHSCISQRFGTHDGTCYGCVIRKLAAIATGVKDVNYRKNVLVDDNASSGNLFALLRFSFDFLTSHESMEDFETENIKAYGKQDLFRRFALDNFAAIHRQVLEGRRVRRSVRQIYEELKQAIGVNGLDRRLLALRDGTVSPNFSSGQSQRLS